MAESGQCHPRHREYYFLHDRRRPTRKYWTRGIVSPPAERRRLAIVRGAAFRRGPRSSHAPQGAPAWKSPPLTALKTLSPAHREHPLVFPARVAYPSSRMRAERPKVLRSIGRRCLVARIDLPCYQDEREFHRWRRGPFVKLCPGGHQWKEALHTDPS
jgi:hypothetical protein